MILDKAGLDVVGQAADGAKGIALAESLGPDIVLIDVRTPGVNGVDATRRVTSLAAAERGLRGYVEPVARGLGVEAAASVCEWSPPTNAYIALTERLPSFRPGISPWSGMSATAGLR